MLKLFTNWWNKTGETPTKTEYFDYKKAIREREDQEREYLKKWRKEFKQRMNNSNNTYSTSIGHLPSSVAQKYANITFSDNTINKTTLKVDGDLIINDRDVMKELDEMRDALLLLKRDVDMESKYPRLRELKDEYERALEKYKTFEALK